MILLTAFFSLPSILILMTFEVALACLLVRMAAVFHIDFEELLHIVLIHPSQRAALI